MSGFLDYLARLIGGAAFWVVVLPWQQALRVRAGRFSRLLGPGIYLKLPILDAVKVESIRRRTAMAPTQSLSTADGATVVVGAVVAYAIRDLQTLFLSLNNAEDVTVQTAQGEIAATVFKLRRDEIAPDRLREIVKARLADAFDAYGLCEVELNITDFCFVKTFRLIQDTRWSHGRALDTQDRAPA